MSTNFQDSLLESLQYGFMNSRAHADKTYAPRVLINNPDEKRFVITDIDEELRKCSAFYFSVAFVTQSGIGLIKTQLKDLEDQGVHGKIIISPYLDFNDPLALRDLLKLKNVDVRMSPPELQLHAKYYMFEHDNQHVIISGSSNLTGNALKRNYEWNIKLTSAQDGDLVYRTREEFKRVWDMAEPLTEALIFAYEKRRKTKLEREIVRAREVEDNPDEEIQPNLMQIDALKGLQVVRDKDEKRALVISATGTGKTYLSALDVKQAKPERMLFIVHREQILNKALESFQRVLRFEEKDACIYKSGDDISEKKYVFATIQTLSRDENLESFDPQWFNYILIDEVHKAGAPTYKKVMDYFDPDFLLGMTATPERTDGQNIYELFDYNVAYEIRLQDALDNDLLCPFLYYGVTDIEVDGELLGDNATFENLVSDIRVNHILEKVNYYGHSGEKVQGLIFCSRKGEAHELSGLLNARGLKTVALTGDDSQAYREEVVKKLQNGELDYILTVDIFNEGIDIPSVNQVVMLRNTQSSIIFVQQLGRGLRKHPSKEFVTIIDFIGNYSNNYLIPVALFGDQSMDKDNYRRDVRQSLTLRGLTTVNFEEIARKQIFQSITDVKLSSMKNLRDNFVELRNRIGRIPYLCDFITNKSMEPLAFFDNNAFKDYSDVINKFVAPEEKIALSEIEKQFLRFVTFELAAGKRQHELVLLEMLIEENGSVPRQQWLDNLSAINIEFDDSTIASVERVLGMTFLKQAERKQFGGTPLVNKSADTYVLNPDIARSLRGNPQFARLFTDVIHAGRMKQTVYPDVFTLGRKYTRRDVLKLLNMKQDMPPLNIGGYYIDKATHSCPIFVTYKKSEDISDTIKYRDGFIDESTLAWESKSGRTLESDDVLTLMTSNSTNLRIELFMIKDDNEGVLFYYLGGLKYEEGSAELLTQDTGKTVVGMRFELKSPVEPSLYRYITQE
ncbi:DUF3427 domain-containing protein [Alloscardovia omnicolens]|uniref:DUF3427 domain-containing protein n=1 Tax=Alloscardovia omnicolens TaxID=419015 RepID=UPI00066683AB|nr:DEAD/DEAH box helicase [Alloscardovia omnicolens]MDK6327359.1 DEAD/DEAH box helicase [Alloscardovia omnicolens]MDK8073819.1 DEAD/DEAH box helicase [Alloscardovia omnicolens]MDK8081791.1 DEAD/DEAH box helicase [Alloscardovia omnicolens]